MFGSTIIDVLIGLFLVYIVLSMMASAVNEFISNWLDKRAKDLETFVKNLFAETQQSGGGSTKVNDFFSSIFVNTQIGTKQLPSYITKEDFVQTLFDVAKITVNAEDDLKTLRSQITAALPPDSPVLKVLLNAIDRTDGTRAQVTAQLEKWFDGQMDHLRAQYKKWTNYVLLGIGLVVAILLNVDTIRVADALLTSPTLRDTIVEQAKNITPSSVEDQSFTALQAQLNELSLPIGWPEPGAPVVSDAGFGSWLVKKIIGILVTAFAVSQGAPFWFDLLNKITNLRAANRPPDEQARQAGSQTTAAPTQAATGGDTTNKPS
jgi:hypothetical protein